MPQGLVIKSTGSWYSVLFEGKIISCNIRGKLRLKGIKSTNPVTVGDMADFEFIEVEGQGIITKIHPRKNYIIRKATRFHAESHLLAANIDQALLFVCLKNPQTPLEFIDRFLLTAEAYFIPTTIVLNKSDLSSSEEIEEFVNIYRLAGYETIPISVLENKNVEKVITKMQNKITLLAGNSGVGKSSLINGINPLLDLKVNAISDYHKSGKHTTTFSELFIVQENMYVVDTPGIRSFGIIDIDESEVGLYFKEIFHISKNCKFSNCKHVNEPGCAVVEAFKDGLIAESRYKSYLNIVLDDKSKYR